MAESSETGTYHWLALASDGGGVRVVESSHTHTKYKQLIENVLQIQVQIQIKAEGNTGEGWGLTDIQDGRL